MRVAYIRPRSLRDSPAAGRQPGYQRTACPRCGTFLVEPALLLQSWLRLASEDALLTAFLPTSIRDCNRRNHIPLLTLKNWRTLARRGCLLALHSEHP